MIDKRQLATLLCTGESVLNYKQWVAQEAGELALKIANLDEIPPLAILLLAELVANGKADQKKLAIAIDTDESKLQDYLEALCEFKFANETWNGYEPTPSGERAFMEIGKKMVIRERFELKRRFEQLEGLYQKLSDS